MIGLGGLLVCVTANVGAVVWGAAKLSSAVENLRATVAELKAVVMRMQEVTHNLVGRVWVLEDRIGIPHRRITDVQGDDPV